MSKENLLNWLKSTEVPLTVISKKTSISRATLYNWINGGEIRNKSYTKIYESYKDEIELINTDIKLNKEFNVEAQYIINLQKEKIERLEADIEKHESNSVQSTHWDTLQHDFYVEVKLSFNAFSMGKTIVEVKGMRNMSKIFGYSLKEIENMWDIGTHYKNFTDHPIDTIITNKSKKEIEKKKDVLPSIFQQLKDMVGNHYIPLPISYNAKDGKVVHTITYNKVNWRKKTVDSKIQVLND